MAKKIVLNFHQLLRQKDRAAKYITSIENKLKISCDLAIERILLKIIGNGLFAVYALDVVVLFAAGAMTVKLFFTLNNVQTSRNM